LAGGVAHDFNNILTAIIGYGNLILMKLPGGDTVRPFVSQVLASAERAAQLTHSLLAFSRKQAIDPRNVNINAIIQRVNSLLLKLIGEDIEFKTVLCNRDLTVLADSVQMEQVLMNLVVNARDAWDHADRDRDEHLRDRRGIHTDPRVRRTRRLRPDDHIRYG
jgi:signal transduction histidine kinase